MSAGSGDARREKIMGALRGADGPLSGGELAEACGVSRQVVVTDIALLRTRGEKIVSKEDIRAFAEAGADVILLPAPGTVPGVTFEFVHEMVSYIHELGKLSLTAIGTSQEGASAATIEQIALMCKMTGTDLHHVGDAGVGGLNPENLMAYSIAIRGKRHTYLRMARSINR